MLGQLEVTFKDDSKQIIITDNSWKTATGPILASDIYDGEIYDARLEKTGWNKAGFDDSGWAGVAELNHRKDFLIAPDGPPVKKIEPIKPVKLIKTPAGETVIDMGQNMVGWIQFKVRGESGAKVKLRHTEVLDKDGNFIRIIYVMPGKQLNTHCVVILLKRLNRTLLFRDFALSLSTNGPENQNWRILQEWWSIRTLHPPVHSSAPIR